MLIMHADNSQGYDPHHISYRGVTGNTIPNASCYHLPIDLHHDQQLV